MALQVGLADFQFVHPTETESFTVKEQTNLFEEDRDRRVRQVVKDKVVTRRKRVALAGAKVVVKSMNSSGKRIELTFETDGGGRAICAVTQDQLPQLPTETEFEIRLPGGRTEHGKIRCGGNEHVPTTEVVVLG